MAIAIASHTRPTSFPNQTRYYPAYKTLVSCCNGRPTHRKALYCIHLVDAPHPSMHSEALGGLY